MWRPEGWAETLDSYWETKTKKLKDPNIFMVSMDRGDFEAGADAMYQPAYRKGRKDAREALRKGASININTKALGKGKWVFLPDEEE